MKNLYLIPVLVFAMSVSNAALASDIYKVKHVGQGNSLTLHAYPSRNSRTIVAIPHNASWIMKRRAKKKVEGATWHKVMWNNQEGWVKDDNLSKDPVSTRMARGRLRCLKNPKTKDKMCCGYPASEVNKRVKHIDILAIKNTAVGKTVPLRTIPGKWKGKVIVAIPHNATWVARLEKEQKLANGEIWSYVRWNGQTGWINNANVRFDRGTTIQGDRKRQRCSRK